MLRHSRALILLLCVLPGLALAQQPPPNGPPPLEFDWFQVTGGPNNTWTFEGHCKNTQVGDFVCFSGACGNFAEPVGLNGYFCITKTYPAGTQGMVAAYVTDFLWRASNTCFDDMF